MINEYIYWNVIIQCFAKVRLFLAKQPVPSVKKFFDVTEQSAQYIYSFLVEQEYFITMVLV